MRGCEFCQPNGSTCFRSKCQLHKRMCLFEMESLNETLPCGRSLPLCRRTLCRSSRSLKASVNISRSHLKHNAGSKSATINTRYGSSPLWGLALIQHRAKNQARWDGREAAVQFYVNCFQNQTHCDNRDVYSDVVTRACQVISVNSQMEMKSQV